MDMLPIWSENCTVRFGAVDRSDLMTLNAVFAFFQEAAISHAENLGVGRDALAEANQAWIISRMSVLIERRPKYRETVTVRTWPRGSEKLFAIRDYDIRDDRGNAAVRARSCWLIIDMEKRRPIRPQAVVEKLPRNEGIASLEPADFIPAPLEERLTQGSSSNYAERKALYTDVDYFGHVNNVSYIRWIENAVDPALLEQAGRMRLDINYMNEILPGELAGICASAIDSAETGLNAFAIEGRKQAAGGVIPGIAIPGIMIPAFRAELRLWRGLTSPS